MKKIILLVVLSIMYSTSFSQERIVYGKVVFNEYPLANIVVTAKKAKTTVQTDSLGAFAITCQKKDILIFKSKNFKEGRKKVRKNVDSVLVSLLFKEDSKEYKNEMVATGYGYTRKENSSYAISNVSDKDDDCFRYKDIYDMIEGSVPGVTVNKNGDVLIRGVGSVNGNIYALVIINGMSGELSTVLPCEVEHLSILKGPSAAIYGSRGANGVVLIETK